MGRSMILTDNDLVGKSRTKAKKKKRDWNRLD